MVKNGNASFVAAHAGHIPGRRGHLVPLLLLSLLENVIPYTSKYIFVSFAPDNELRFEAHGICKTQTEPKKMSRDQPLRSCIPTSSPQCTRNIPHAAIHVETALLTRFRIANDGLCWLVCAHMTHFFNAQIVLSREQAEGQGALVRRSIGGGALRNFDPFLLLDEFDVATTAGFPDHPHRYESMRMV